MLSTPASSGTCVPADAVEYSQFSDTYRPVPVEPLEFHPAAADSAESVISEFDADTPGKVGAVPSTATFPVTAACHAVPIASPPLVPVVGSSDEHDPPDDG